MVEHGGKREGSGRPSGALASSTIQSQIQRHRLVQLLENEIEPIFKALTAKAKKGDVSAAKELFDRAWGKSHQSMTVDSTIEDKRIPQNIEARKAAAKAYAEALRGGA